MKLVISHIEFLLSEHDCVIVPGFGGFVVQEVNAKVGSSQITSPTRDICFNTDLIHDDGLLLSHIVKIEGIEYTTAKAMLQRDILQLRATLTNNAAITFGSIGKFTMQSDSGIQFHPTRLASVSIYHFGMKPVTLTLLSELPVVAEAKTEPKIAPKVIATHEDTVHIQFSRRKFVKTAASVAAIGILWVLSSPFQLNHYSNNSASLIPTTELIKSYTAPVVVAPADTVAVVDTVAVEAPAKEEATVVKAEKPVVREAAPPPTVAEEVNAEYYIVLGSFQSESSALRHQQLLIADGIPNVQVAKLGTMSRTYLCSFTDKKEAESYIRNVRYTRPEYNEAWLYCKK